MLKKARRFGAMMACAGILSISTHVSANPYEMCFDDEDTQSAQIHQFQTMLMVGSLKCRGLDPSSLRRYGDFVTSRSGDLAMHTDAVRESFNQRFGTTMGTRMFRLYETSLGNEFSRIDMNWATCQDLGTYARMAERANHADIATIAGLATNRTVPFCPASHAGETAVAHAPEPVAASRPVAAIRPGPHEAEFEEIVAAPVVPIADETAAPISPEPVAANGAAAGKDARLQQAIEALDNAGNALRAMQSGSGSTE